MFKLMREKADGFPTTILMLVKGLILVNTCTVITLLITICLPSCIMLRCYPYRCYKTVTIKGFQCSSSSVVFIRTMSAQKAGYAHLKRVCGIHCPRRNISVPLICEEEWACLGPSLPSFPAALGCGCISGSFFLSHILRLAFWIVQHSPSPARLPWETLDSAVHFLRIPSLLTFTIWTRQHVYISHQQLDLGEKYSFWKYLLPEGTRYKVLSLYRNLTDRLL